LGFIEANHSRPFFLQLWHYTVHSPLMGKPELVEKYGKTPGSNGQSNAVYAAMVQSMDESVGRILQKLDALKISDRTIVVFTSDNGGAVHFGKPPATSNLPLRLGKGFAYEGGLRVPLLVRAPGVGRPGMVCDTPVISTDFFPTLLELAGAGPEAAKTAVDGRSFVPLLRGEARPPHTELFWHYPHYWNGGKVSPYSVARIGDWKLIRFYETDREELYNLKEDPSEEHDLAGTETARRRELGTRLSSWLKEVGAQMPVPRQ
jgi:arylsulfatase A-like enzyme